MSHEVIGQLVSKAYAKLQQYNPDNGLLRFVEKIDIPTETPVFSSNLSSEFRKNYIPRRGPEAERSFTAMWNYFLDMAEAVSE
jgi:hypothetical protein